MTFEFDLEKNGIGWNVNDAWQMKIVLEMKKT